MVKLLIRIVLWDKAIAYKITTIESRQIKPKNVHRLKKSSRTKHSIGDRLTGLCCLEANPFRGDYRVSQNVTCWHMILLFRESTEQS